MNSAFIPVFNSFKSKEKQNYFFNFIFLVFLIALTISSALVFWQGAEIITNFFLIFNQNSYSLTFKNQTINLIKILFPYIIFISLTSIVNGVLQSYTKFKTAAWTPIIFNLVIILGLILIYSNLLPTENISFWLAIFVILAGLVNLIFALLFFYRLGFKLQLLQFFSLFSDITTSPEFKRFLKLMIPVLLSSGIYQLNILLIDPFAIAIGTGSVTILFLCQRLLELPLGIFGVSITTASLPTLAKLAREQQREKIKNLVLKSVDLVFMLFFPIGFFFFFYHPEIISVIFEWGTFSSQQVTATTEVFFYYIFSLWAIPLYRILLNVFYALQNTRILIYFFFFNLIVNLSLVGSLTFLIAETYILALSSTLTSFILFFFLVFYLQKKHALNLLRGIWKLNFKWIMMIIPPLFFSLIFKKLMEPFWLVIYQQFQSFWWLKILKLAEFSLFGLFFLFFYLTTILIKQKKILKRNFFI